MQEEQGGDMAVSLQARREVEGNCLCPATASEATNGGLSYRFLRDPIWIKSYGQMITESFVLSRCYIVTEEPATRR